MDACKHLRTQKKSAKCCPKLKHVFNLFFFFLFNRLDCSFRAQKNIIQTGAGRRRAQGRGYYRVARLAPHLFDGFLRQHSDLEKTGLQLETNLTFFVASILEDSFSVMSKPICQPNVSYAKASPRSQNLRAKFVFDTAQNEPPEG